jgi:beta-lactamase regulating signal transducer with metallopeptidase domain/protocatechuate 3,4-dioxygenase beta subunit
MNDGAVSFWFFTLLDLSVRWGIAIALLTLGFWLFRPARAQVRLLLCQVVLFGGCLFLFEPVFWGPTRMRTAPPSAFAGDSTGGVSDRHSMIASTQDLQSPSAQVVDRPAEPAQSTPSPIRDSTSEPSALRSSPPERNSSIQRPNTAEAAPDVPTKTSAVDFVTWIIHLLAVGWLGGVLFCFGRLMAGWIWLLRLTQTSGAVSRAASELLDQCCQALQLQVRVALFIHPRVQSPALVGYRRPAILLPANWDALPLLDRRAALMHELTHLARRDHWAKLVDESVRALFFFHPLVLWLLRCQDGAREELCDDAVVKQGIAPRDLAHVLVEFAKQQQVRALSDQSGLATAFLKTKTVKLRIERLLEDDFMIRTKPLLQGWKLGLALIALAFLAGLGGVGLRTEAAQEKAGASLAPKETPKALNSGKAFDNAAKPFVQGTVVDEAGQPVAQADVLLHRGMSQGKPAFTRTDAQGKFQYDSLPGDKPNGYAMTLVAVRAGYAPAEGHPIGDRAVNLVLAKPTQAHGMVKDRKGKAVANAQVQLGVVENHGNIRSWGYVDRDVIRGTVFEPYFQAITDADGTFQFSTAPAGKALIFRTQATGFADFDSSESGPGGERFAKPDAGPVELVLAPEARIEGQVVSDVPGVLVGGLRVFADATRGNGISKQTLTDDQGKFLFAGVPETMFTLWVDVPATLPCTSRALNRLQLRAGDAAKVKLDLIPGVLIEGRVLLAGTSTPVAGASVEVRSREVPHNASVLRQAHTGADGKYSLRLPAGNVTLFVRNMPAGLQPGRQGGQAAVAIPEGVTHLDGPTLTCESRGAVLAADPPVVARQRPADAKAPTFVEATGHAPARVASDELAGIVLDEKKQPVADVHVHIWDWVDLPQNQTRTDKDGKFRLTERGSRSKVQVRFRKPGFSPVMIVQQPLGVGDLVVVMDSKTYFQGVVYGPDGKPAPNALIRADQGPKRGDGVLITEVWTDTKADQAGRYRLYLEPDSYAFSVKAPGFGTTRLEKRPISHGETPTLDFKLQEPVVFRALISEAGTNKPVSGVRLYNWRQKDVDGKSDASGVVEIRDMLPGVMQLEVKSNTHTRWWSAAATQAHQHYEGVEQGSAWQRNFDHLEFDVQRNMPPVQIIVEKGARVTGQVLGPEGKPVAGATVAPALTGSGNSLTGDTRFSVLSEADGKFTMLLPASHGARYNLVAHDGKYNQWRTWANGVMPPIQTTPGQEINNVTISLTRPAIVRGKVLDAQGRPVAGREVRASAADKMENRYYDPTTRTKDDGTFELKFIRAGEQHIQAAPFWLSAEQAPGGTSKTIVLKEGETVESISLIGAERIR